MTKEELAGKIIVEVLLKEQEGLRQIIFNLQQQNTELLEDVAALRLERASLKLSIDLLTGERDGKGGWKDLVARFRETEYRLTAGWDALKAELLTYREGGLTEEILRKGDGYIKVGRGCLIISEQYLEEKDAEIAALKAKTEERQTRREP